MRLRSLLFVPGDRPERFDKAAASGADAVILDLEDSVVPGRKGFARGAVAEQLRAERGAVRLFVRVNPEKSEFHVADVAALAGGWPDGVVLPKAEGAGVVRQVAARLADAGLDGVGLLPIATETPAALFRLDSYAEVSDRLVGLTWGAEDLPAAIGAATSREPDGRYTPPYELARSLTLFGAHAAGVTAIETVFPFIQDADGLSAYAARAARDGFLGMLAIHPSQVATLNAAFSPDEAAVARAHAIIAAFAAAPGIGALRFEGSMIDAPHLRQARAVLERAQSSGGSGPNSEGSNGDP